MIAMKDLVNKIISMYAKGMTTRQISKTIEDIYGFEVSEGMVSDITDKLLPRIEEAPSPSARSMGGSINHILPEYRSPLQIFPDHL